MAANFTAKPPDVPNTTRTAEVKVKLFGAEVAAYVVYALSIGTVYARSGGWDPLESRAAMIAPTGPLTHSIRWAIVLGGVGFAAGFFGPMILNPEANIGPIVGILFSGPAGAVAGALLGALFGALPVSPATRRWILTLACTSLALGTLYYCLPDPAVRGYIIDAQVESCAPATQSIGEAAEKWDQALARVTWATPTANWKETAIENVRRDSGVVLTLSIVRKAAILRHRRPWDGDRTSAAPWVTVAESTRYYADNEGPTCGSYLARPRQLYWPAIDPDSDPMKPSPVWPPTDTLGFLQLQRLEAVPDDYQRLLP